MNPEDQLEVTTTRRRKITYRRALCVVAGVLFSVTALADEPYAACVTCHGEAGNNPIPGMMAPKLAGLDAAYTRKELDDFKMGYRKFDAMNTLAKGLSESDIKADAEFFSEQTRTPNPAADQSRVKEGEQIVKHGIASQAVPACVNCHNDGLTGTFRYPRLAGQQEDYVVNQLTHLKSGERHNDFGQMQRVAARLTDDQIKAIAQYISALR